MDKYIKCDQEFIDGAIHSCSASTTASLKIREFLENYPALNISECCPNCGTTITKGMTDKCGGC